MDPKSKEIIESFITLLAEVAAGLLGANELTKLVPEITVRTGLSRLWQGRIQHRLNVDNRTELETKIGVIVHHLERSFGEKITETWLEDAYTKLERQYSPALANELVLPLIPQQHLDKYRLRIFSREELATMLEHERRRDRELAEANTRLTEIDRRKSEFISVVAHQLRTPLGGFKWALDILAKGQAGPVTPEQKEIIEKSYRENEYMIALVEDMLRADRIEAGQFALAPAPADLFALLTDVVAELADFAARRKVRLELPQPVRPLPKVTFDQKQMHIALQNLIENAVRYSPADSVVTVAARAEGATAVVTVADHGIGIPKSEESEIFSRFFRAGNARKKEPDGNGLGLYITKSIIALHGGTIRFTTEEGRGTTFFVTLPL